MPATKTASKAKPQDAIALLKADHTAVSQLFAEYPKTRSASNKQALVAQICTALRVHAQIEEEIFYPAVKEEQTEMFAQAKAAGLDMLALGAQLAARKSALLAAAA